MLTFVYLLKVFLLVCAIIPNVILSYLLTFNFSFLSQCLFRTNIPNMLTIEMYSLKPFFTQVFTLVLAHERWLPVPQPGIYGKHLRE